MSTVKNLHDLQSQDILGQLNRYIPCAVEMASFFKNEQPPVAFLSRNYFYAKMG
jgi:hypothetical protein